MPTLDLNILPICRINGQELAEMPGLLAVTPPRKTARGREQNTLIAQLALSGNIPFSKAEITQLLNEAASLFYQSPGSLTSAMRSAANEINARLLARNLAAASLGQHSLGLLTLAALRDNQCTLLLSGPTHVVWVTEGGSRHVHDPALSGKGLGSGQSVSAYLSQVELRPQDLLVLCEAFPRDWEADLLNERPPTSLDASYRKLTLAKGDLNAVLIQVQNGEGTITLLRPEPGALRPAQPVMVPAPPQAPAPRAVEAQQSPEHEPAPAPEPSPITEEQLDALADFAAHMVQPSAYAIPPQPPSAAPAPKQENKPNGARAFPASIPRAKPPEPQLPPEQTLEVTPELSVEEPVEPTPRVSRLKPKRRLFKPGTGAAATRQVAKVAVGGFQAGRRINERVRAFFQKFIPRLLPGSEPNRPLSVPTYILILITLVIPLVIGTVGSVVYFRFGQSIQYDELYQQARNTGAQAASEPDPARQRDQWQQVLRYLDDAEKYRETDQSRALRSEAQAKLDSLMGVVRLEFAPAFPNGLGRSVQISRMAASESDLYMLDAEDGKILHASFTGRSLNQDNTFSCQPGTYTGNQVGRLVDILALPKVNAINATVLGIDASGNLLYCAPNQVPQAMPLPALPNTNWKHITAFALDSGNLYVLDADARAVWVFPGKDSSFVDAPYFYFGNDIPNSINSAIDLAVSSDDLYLLHADGHLSTCTFSRLSEVPTRCQDPAPRLDNYAAHQGVDIFRQANLTQLAITNPPNSVLLLLDSESRSVFRFSPRAFELQNQIESHTGQGNPFQSGPAGALAVSPNYVLYIAIGNQVYFATKLP